MSTFKAGDRVRVVEGSYSKPQIEAVGKEFVVSRVCDMGLVELVGVDDDGIGFWTHELELVTNDPNQTMVAAETGSLRDNAGKVPFSEVPLEASEAIATVLFKSSKEGGGKYPRRNWKKGNKHSVPMDSLLRHAAKRSAGQMNDPESGMPHSWHILINAVFLVFYEKHFPQLNDLKDEESK